MRVCVSVCVVRPFRHCWHEIRWYYVYSRENQYWRSMHDLQGLHADRASTVHAEYMLHEEYMPTTSRWHFSHFSQSKL